MFTAYVKIGVYDYDDQWTSFIYNLPEVLILALCALNEIKLKLIGLYYQIEEDVETIEDGIQRNILKGDELQMRLQKKEKTGMIMTFLFESVDV